MRANNVVKSLLLVSALRLCSASLAFTTETVNVWPEGRMPSVQTNQCTERDEQRRTGGELKFMGFAKKESAE